MQEERRRRKAFYLRNGLERVPGCSANVITNTDFEILTPDGDLSFQEYVEFSERKFMDEE